MQLARWIALVALLGLSAAFLVWVDRLRHAPLEELIVRPAPATAVAPAAVARNLPLAFRSARDCGGCHATIHAEWQSSPHARRWGTHPQIPKDPLRLDCSPCHIPDRIYDHGLDKPAVLRPDRHHEGVGCIACHVKGQEVLGPGATRAAPCNPRHEPTITKSVTCAPCHALHGTLDEWRASRFGPDGPDTKTCQDCHMPRIERDGKGGTRRGRSHHILGGRDQALLRSALSLDVRAGADAITVALTNDGTGHAVPGEINNRKLVLHLNLRSPGRSSERQRDFQAPPRPKRGLVPTTQIMPGATVRERVPLPVVGQLEVALEYRLFWLWPVDPYRVVRLTVIQLPGWTSVELRQLR